MARDRKPRNWVKIDCEGILRGSLNYLLKLDEQAVWIKMLAYSEVCGGRSGYIEDNNQRGMPHEHIAHELHCPVEILDRVIEIMVGDKAVKVNGTGSIHLVNFSHYQFNEYDRQSVYRKKGGDGPQTFEEYVEAIKPNYSDLEVDKELEKFNLWWSEGSKELKRPKLAFRNWLDKARVIKDGTHKSNTTKDEQDSDRFVSGRYGFKVRH